MTINRKTFVLAILSGILVNLSNLSLKAHSYYEHLFAIFLAILLGAGALLLLIKAYKTDPRLSLVAPLMASSQFIIPPASAWLFLEAVSVYQYIGIALFIIGIILIKP